MTKGFFESAEPKAKGTGNPIGHIGNTGNSTTYLDEQYKNNPYYHPTTN